MLPSQQSELWSRLEELDLDGNAQLSLSRRLARDNGWTPEFARRVVDEYKKFVFLAATAGHPVTPSDEVDQAWHLHLVYTRSYWDELCGEILGFPLHHGPTKGGRTEGAKFGDWYARTLESYRRIFDQEPPRDVWPDASIRFGEAPHFRRVNTKRAWVVRKPAWTDSFSGLKFRRPVLWKRLAPVVLLLLLAGCAAPTTLNVSRWNGTEFLSVYWTLCALVVGGILFLRSRGEPPYDSVFPIEPLDGYEVARLKDGGTLAVDVALAVLHQQGAVEVKSNSTVRATGTPAQGGQFEKAVMQEIHGDNSPIPGRRGLTTSALGAQIEAIDQKLQGEGLLLMPEARRNANKMPLAVTVVLFVIGLIRMLVGIERERPVGFLVMSLIAVGGFAIFLATNPPRRSKRGNALLKEVESSSAYAEPQMKAFRLAATQHALTGPTNDIGTLALLFAVGGASVFPADLRQILWPQSSGDSGGSSDSGGDGGGSGCGGCGGCGGGGGD